MRSGWFGKLGIIMAVALLTFGLTACGSGGDDGGGGNELRTLTGVVTDQAANNQPVVGATVRVTASNGVIKSATTDAQGRFTIADLPATGNLMVRVTKDLFLEFTTTITDPNQTSLTVTLNPEFNRPPPPPDFGSV